MLSAEVQQPVPTRKQVGTGRAPSIVAVGRRYVSLKALSGRWDGPRGECEADRLPHLNADGILLVNLNAVKKAPMPRVVGTNDPMSPAQEVGNA